MLNTQTQEARNQRAALEAQIKKATDIQDWVQGSRPIQPLLVEITRGRRDLDGLDWDAVDALVRERLTPLTTDDATG